MLQRMRNWAKKNALKNEMRMFWATLHRAGPEHRCIPLRSRYTLNRDYLSIYFREAAGVDKNMIVINFERGYINLTTSNTHIYLEDDPFEFDKYWVPLSDQLMSFCDEIRAEELRRAKATEKVNRDILDRIKYR